MDLKLQGRDIELLRDALMEAFPEERQFRELLLFEFDCNIADIVQRGTYPDEIRDVITNWAMPRSKVALLIRRARRRNKEGKALQRFEKDRLPPFVTEALSLLGDLIRELSLSRDQLFAMACECVSTGLRPLEQELPRSLDEASGYLIEMLSSVADTDVESHPLCSFIHRILGEITQKKGAPLRKWLIDAGGLSQSGRGVALAVTESPYLLIRIVPLSTRKNRCSVRAWLLGKRRPRDLFEDEGNNEKECSFDDLPGIVEGLRLRLANLQNRDYPIEFLVPDDLLNEGFDELLIGDGDGTPKSKLGVLHPVSVRSSTRLSNPLWKQSLRHRCGQKSRICQLPGRDAESGVLSQHVQWMPDDDDGMYRTLRPEGVACTLFRLPPQELQFKYLWRHGVGAALWARSAPVEEVQPTPQGLESLIHSGPLGMLREGIFERRKDARTEANHPARRVTLLWDDPEHLPPERALMSPQRRKERP